MNSPIYTGSTFLNSTTLNIQGNIYLEIKEYRIYWNKGQNKWELLDTVLEDGRGTYWYKTGHLEPGTYQFKVNPVDVFGNERDSVLIRSITIHGLPQPPENVRIAGIENDRLIIEYEPSPTPQVIEYRLYGNTGNGDNINYKNILATSNTTQIISPVLYEGYWKFIVKAWDGTYEDNNVSTLLEVWLVGEPLEITTPPPRKVVSLIGESYQGGRAKLTFMINNRLGYPAKYAKIYQDLNFDFPIETLEIKSTRDIITKTWISEPYVGTKKWTVRLASGDSKYSEEQNTDYVEVTAYPYPPPEVKNFNVYTTF